MINDKGRLVENDVPIIDYFILHHTAGDEGVNHFDSAIRESLNEVGYNRGYAPKDKGAYDFKTGYSKSQGRSNLKRLVTGETGYAEYHYAIHAYDLDKGSPYYQKGGYRIVPLLDDPLWCDAGSTNNKDINSRAIAACVCGDFDINEVSSLFVDWFINQFGTGHYFNWILRKNPMIHIFGHRDIDSTKCPGKYLYAYMPMIQKGIARISAELT